MLRLFTKNNGAVTVFLVLIMVPVITVATVFVDASRLRMAESIVNSSADLTLETVMAKYDAELSDYYGLLASAQDAEDMVNKANEYLVSAMTSQGLSEAQATSLLSTAVDKFSSDDIVDMLQLSLAGGEDGGEGEGSASVVSPVENGDLTNAAIVKKQISEFMKYRAPVNLVVKIIKKFTKAKDGVELAQQETDLAEKKKTFFETENELLQLAYDVYELRLEYIGHFNGDISQYMEDMKAALNSYEEKYREYHKYLVMDLYNSENTPSFTLPKLDSWSESGAYHDDNKADKDTIKKLAEDLEDACADFREAMTNLGKVEFLDYKDSMYPVQYWVQMMAKMNNKSDNVFTKYANAQKSLVSIWTDLECALDHKEEDVDLSEKYSKSGKGDDYTLENYTSDMMSDAKSLYMQSINYGTTYYKIGEKIEAGSKYVLETNPNKKYYPHSKLSDELKAIKQQLDGYCETLNKAKTTANAIVSKCKKIIELAPKYKDDYDTWCSAAKAMDPKQSDMAATDQDEINQNGKVMEAINEENVAAAQARYENIGELLGNILVDIDSYKYGPNKKKLKDIEKFKDMKNASGVDGEKIVLDKSTLEGYAASSFVFEQPESLYLDTINESNQPDTVKFPSAFEEWLIDKFEENYSEEDKEDGEEQREAIKKNGEDKADEENTSVVENVSKEEINGQPDLPSQGGSDTQDAAGDDAIERAGSSISKIADYFTLTDNVERLYALDYVMSMFTYDTYLYEGMYKNATDLGYSSEPPTDISGAKTFHTDTYDAWNAKADDPKFTADKTLTNKVRSMDTQFSFGNEVEYILYGDTNSENKLCAYGTIYLIRYAMNTGPMFAKGWKSKLVNEIATGISTLTQGVIPVPLIKVLIILALIAFESAYDIALLQQGLPVLFVKGEDNLYIDPDLNLDGDGLVKEADESKAETKGENILEDLNQFFYSDYLTLFLFVSLTVNEEKTYSRIADVIQVNMVKNTGNDGYRLSKSQVYYKIDANVEMPAFMMKLPINQDASVWEQMKNSKYQIQYSEIRGY